MDEPLSNLDAKLRVSMRTELKAIHDKTDATTVFVTHDQSEAMSMADRIVIMKDGEVIQVGTPEDVYHRSATIFVADFIGTPPTNFMDVELSTQNGKSALKNPNFTMAVPAVVASPLKKHGKDTLIIGIRPENISIVSEGDALFSAPCLVCEPQGSHQVVAIEMDEKIVKIVAEAQPKVHPGEVVHMAFNQDTLRYFDKDTGLSIGD